MKLPETGNIRAKISELHNEYMIDQRELGKVMVIASTALLIVSVHATLVFQSSAKDVRQTNMNFDRAEAIISSPSFNDSVEALSTAKGTTTTGVAASFAQAATAFQQAGKSLRLSDNAQDRLEDNAELYQWLVLVALLGEVAGVAVVYI